MSSKKTGRAASMLLRERAYAQIRSLIVLGEFPTGQRIGEEHVAERLQMSRTPIREALLRLHADRLLDRYEDSGYYVAEVNLLSLRDLYEVRLTLELRGVSRALEDGIVHDRSTLEQLRAEWVEIQQQDHALDGSFIELDEDFHVGLAAASGNAELVDILRSINVRIRPIRIYDFVSTDRISTSIEEHLAIVDAIMEDDIPLAVHRLRDHIGSSLAVVEQRAIEGIRARALRPRRPASKAVQA